MQCSNALIKPFQIEWLRMRTGVRATSYFYVHYMLCDGSEHQEPLWRVSCDTCDVSSGKYWTEIRQKTHVLTFCRHVIGLCVIISIIQKWSNSITILKYNQCNSSLAQNDEWLEPELQSHSFTLKGRVVYTYSIYNLLIEVNLRIYKQEQLLLLSS